MFLNLLMLRRNLFERPAQKRTVGLNRPVPGRKAAHFAGDLNEPEGSAADVIEAAGGGAAEGGEAQ